MQGRATEGSVLPETLPQPPKADPQGVKAMAKTGGQPPRGAGRSVSTMQAILLISAGAALGANARYFLTAWAAARWGAAFPYGTLIINVLGSLGIGLVLGLAAARPGVGPAWQLLLVTGLMGGFTTFSTFSFDTYRLLGQGRPLEAVLNIAASVGLGLLATALGVALARLAP